MTQRLKAHKSGARYLLRPENVAIATYFPISLDVHQVRCIVSRDGTSERGEWITTQPFAHSTRDATTAQIVELNTRLDLLINLEPWANADQYGEDGIEPLRRSIRFWHNDSETMAYLPPRSLWAELGTTTSGVDAFNDAWCSLWVCAGSPADLELSNLNGQPD